MADATGVCYTQSGDVKRYEPSYISYYLFYRSKNDGLDGSRINSYIYKAFFDEYNYTPACYCIGYPIGIRTKHQENSAENSAEKILLLENYNENIDNENIDNENIEEAKFLITPCNIISYSTTQDFLAKYSNYIKSEYDYYNNSNKDLDNKHINSNIYYDSSYAFKKYTYGTEEYNEFVSYIHSATEIVKNKTINSSANFTLQIIRPGLSELQTKDDYSSAIKNFANLEFMPDIIIFQNYGVLPKDVYYPLSKNPNIYVFGVINYSHTIKIRYTLPWFEKYIRQSDYVMNVTYPLGNGTSIISIYYRNYNNTPYCTYNINDYNTYSNYTYFGDVYINNKNPILSYFIQSKIINPTFTMHGNMQYNSISSIYKDWEVTYDTVSKGDVSVFDSDSITTEITSIIDYSYYNSNNDERQSSLFCNTSTANSFIGNKESFSVYGNTSSDSNILKNLAINIYIPRYSYEYKYVDGYTIEYCLENEYSRTFVFDYINYQYKVTKYNIRDIITFNDSNIYISEDMDCMEIESVINGTINIFNKENDYYVLDLSGTKNVIKSFTFTIDCTEINMGYKFYNITAGNNNYYEEFIQIDSNIDFNKIYKTKETFTISAKVIKDLSELDPVELILGFGLFFYPLKGSRYIDIRQNVGNSDDNPSVYVDFCYAEQG